MQYVISHSFLPETLELAEEYVITATNEYNFYLHVCGYLKKTFFFLGSDLCHYIDETKSEYMKILTRVNQQDKRYFASLVRALVYEHYFEELVKPHTNQPLSYFVSKIHVNTPDILEQINNHIHNAEKHLRTVENKMNTLTKYEDQVLVEVKLIHGKPVELWTESELITVIREARSEQREIADLVETSSRMKAKHEKLEKDIAVYVAALDALK